MRLKVLFVFLGTLVYISDLVLHGTIHVLHVSVFFYFIFSTIRPKLDRESFKSKINGYFDFKAARPCIRNNSSQLHVKHSLVTPARP